MANIPLLRAVLRHDATRSVWIQPLAVVYWPEVPYLYFKRIANMIRAVKPVFLHHLGILSDTHTAELLFQPISIQDPNYLVYDYSYVTIVITDPVPATYP